MKPSAPHTEEQVPGLRPDEVVPDNPVCNENQIGKIESSIEQPKVNSDELRPRIIDAEEE